MAVEGFEPRILGRVAGVFVGGPKTLCDAGGEWRSSIARDPAQGPAALETRGFVGDRVTQPYHGSRDNAVCLHSLGHYRYWNAHYGMSLAPGGVGENLTLDSADGVTDCDESQMCVGDVIQAGSARLQISGPRFPCENQARRVGRADWVKLTLQTLRTGMYARVLGQGSLQAGDLWLLAERPNPGLTVLDLLRCYFQDFQPEMAARLMLAEGLNPWWTERFEVRLRAELGAR